MEIDKTTTLRGRRQGPPMVTIQQGAMTFSAATRELFDGVEYVVVGRTPTGIGVMPASGDEPYHHKVTRNNGSIKVHAAEFLRGTGIPDKAKLRVSRQGDVIYGTL